MELLKQLYKIHSPSGNERVMKKFIRKYVRKHIPDVKIETDRKGNLYLIKGVAETYPCIVAHLDQVQREHSKASVTVPDIEGKKAWEPMTRTESG